MDFSIGWFWGWFDGEFSAVARLVGTAWGDGGLRVKWDGSGIRDRECKGSKWSWF
jgi:hypothetical protein